LPENEKSPAKIADGIHHDGEDGFHTTTETAAAKDDRKAPAGVIVPPLEIRDIIEKTAQYVSRTNKDFEDRIRENEWSNPKFKCISQPTQPIL
jgi:hypothetical protein